MEQIRIVIADDQALMRDGLKSVLDLEDGFKVVGTAKDGLEACNLVKALKPEILLLDIRMPGMDGVECIKNLRNEKLGTKVIMLTTFVDEDYIIEALKYGASGYLLKDMEVPELVKAIHEAVDGRMIIPRLVAEKLAEGLNKITVKKQEEEHFSTLGLSEREREIAGMLVQGFTNKQISSALYISEGTIRNYISNIYAAIGISDRTQAVLFLKNQGLK